jgi:hypothetical protein
MKTMMVLALLAVAGCGAQEPVAEDEAELGFFGEAPDRLDGLPGSYARSAWGVVPGETVSMALAGGPLGDVAFAGPYTRTLAGCVLPGCATDSGSYHAIPTNPAIGWSIIAFRSDSERPDVAYVIQRLWRSVLTGKITRLSLQRLGDVRPEGPIFGMTRTSL